MSIQLTNEQREKYFRLDKFPLTLPPEQPPPSKDSIDAFIELRRRPPTYYLGWRLPKSHIINFIDDGRWHTAVEYWLKVVIPKWHAKYGETLGEFEPQPFIHKGSVIWHITSNRSATAISKVQDALAKGVVAAAEDVFNLPVDLEESSRLKWHRVGV